MDIYDKKYDAVADIYDQYVNVDFDIPFWIRECIKSGEVLELMAGTGRITIPLAKSGVKVTALDVSRALLKRLSEKADVQQLDIKVVCEDIRTFRMVRKFPLAILPFQAFQELISREDQILALKGIWECLEDDGFFLVSIHNPSFHVKNSGKMPLGEFVEKKSGHLVKFFNNRTVKGNIASNEQIYEEYEGNTLVSERRFINRSYVFTDGEFERLLESSGFSIVQVWGGHNYEPPDLDARFLVYKLIKV